jgi:O-antigen/teichoic acid export membrane protein
MNNTLSQIKKDTISNYAITFIKLTLSIITVPVYLKNFGEELYGVYLMTFALASSLSIFDFGSNKSLIRYAAEFATNKDKNKFEDALSVNLAISLFSAALVLIILIFLGIWAEVFFNLQNQYLTTTKILFFISSIYGALFLLSLVPSNLLQGFSVFHKKNKLQFAPITINILSLLLVYFYQISVVTFSILITSSILITIILETKLLYDLKLLEGIKINLRINKSTFTSKYFAYSINLFFISLLAYFSKQSDKLILSVILSFSTVTVYTIITKPYFILKGLFGNVYSVIQPLMIREKENGNQEKLRKILEDLTKLLFSVSLTMIVAMIIIFKPFLTFWLKTDTYNSEIIYGHIALFCLVITSLSGPIYRYKYFTGQEKELIKIEVIGVSLNLFFSILFCILWGWQGVIDDCEFLAIIQIIT